jgi:hypothetical protein
MRVAADPSLADSEAESQNSPTEAWKEWQVVQDDHPAFLSIGKFLGDEPLPVVRELISDDASDLSSEYEEEDDFDDDDDDEEEEGERCRRQPGMTRENTKRSDHSPEDLSDDEIFASRTVDEGYAMVIVADKDHVDKQVAWNTDSAAYDSELSVSTRRTCNTTASTSRDEASCKSTDSPFFGCDKPEEKSKPYKDIFNPSLKFGPPPGRVMSSTSSRHAEDDSSMDSDSSDDEPFFDEVEPNKGMFELLIDKIIDGMLPHHGLDTPFCDYELDECQEPSDSEPDDFPDERASLFKADGDDDSVDVVDDEAVDHRSVDEIEKLRASLGHQACESLDSFGCVDEIEKERQALSVTISNSDQGTKDSYANLVTEAVCDQGRGARPN